MDLYRFDETRRNSSIIHLAGVDEAGRGPIAGPVVAAAVILDPSRPVNGVNDSKKLSPAFRERLYEEITRTAFSFAVAEVGPGEIDAVNILNATRKAMLMALKGLSMIPDLVLTDAVRLSSLPLPQEAIVRGDAQSASCAAASIVAKVTRDRIMVGFHSIYPVYGFASHKGYPTRAHIGMVRKYGPCPIHRRTFRGVCPGSLFNGTADEVAGVSDRFGRTDVPEICRKSS